MNESMNESHPYVGLSGRHAKHDTVHGVVVWVGSFGSGCLDDRDGFDICPAVALLKPDGTHVVVDLDLFQLTDVDSAVKRLYER